MKKYLLTTALCLGLAVSNVLFANSGVGDDEENKKNSSENSLKEADSIKVNAIKNEFILKPDSGKEDSLAKYNFLFYFIYKMKFEENVYYTE